MIKNKNLMLIYQYCQVKGTWNQISMFDGMLSNGAHVSIVSKEDLLYLEPSTDFQFMMV